MQFDPPLVPATLLRRYKRFLADVILEDGREVTVHCANPGKMLGVSTPGARVWLQPATDPKRKLQWSWRLIELEDGHLAGIDTGVPNRIVGEALSARAIPELAPWQTIRPEVKYGENSRVDFHLSGGPGPDIWLEVKNVHLRREDTLAEFPDSVTTRGAKHLRELSARVAAGERAVMLYVIQRTDCDRIAMAADLDPAYAEAFERAADTGVEMICHGTRISPDGVQLAGALPVIRR
ncbi:DNA/RNA nuclease SfsA [Pontivivens ytuae]|uniref:Sugar fermentation stimulation protein homolog n=1 Tax=Pontivivens ytuae TaxID=2789856 RepID=A0A7S9LU93_9RHOB|nr:DNA/RNA nuclease SfsA [Pontivivens ytuae]QPH55374.1 DNA/RNA nuclease SfsA [Pontivivens ytuae]